jgi:hypothetical protein
MSYKNKERERRFSGTFFVGGTSRLLQYLRADGGDIPPILHGRYLPEAPPHKENLLISGHTLSGAAAKGVKQTQRQILGIAD